jgi:hypothetical protein
MGQRRIDTVKKIQNETNRYVTFCKRKRGLLKKAIELSRLCDQYMYMVIFDQRKQRLVEYCSVQEFDSNIVSKLTNPDLESSIMHERYSNEDYDLFSKEQVTTSKEENSAVVDRSTQNYQLGTREPPARAAKLEAVKRLAPNKKRAIPAQKSESDISSSSLTDTGGHPVITVEALANI